MDPSTSNQPGHLTTYKDQELADLVTQIIHKKDELIELQEQQKTLKNETEKKISDLISSLPESGNITQEQLEKLETLENTLNTARQKSESAIRACKTKLIKQTLVDLSEQGLFDEIDFQKFNNYLTQLREKFPELELSPETFIDSIPTKRLLAMIKTFKDVQLMQKSRYLNSQARKEELFKMDVQSLTPLHLSLVISLGYLEDEQRRQTLLTTIKQDIQTTADIERAFSDPVFRVEAEYSELDSNRAGLAYLNTLWGSLDSTKLKEIILKQS